MDKYYIYEINICITGGGSWRQFFIGYPDEIEVTTAITETLKILTDALKNDPGQQTLLTNTYQNYSQLVRDQRLPNKPVFHANRDTVRVCTYAGATVGYIRAKVIGHACDTQGAQDDF